MGLVSFIKRLQDIMRQDTGVDGDAQRLPQIVWIIFLKVFDFKEEEGELDRNYIPVIPKGYRWRDWAVGKSVKDQLTGPELLSFVNNKLIPVLSGDAIEVNGKRTVVFDKTDKRSLLVKTMMSDATNYMKNGYKLREVINVFNEIDFSDSNETHEFNEVYESMLKGLQSAGKMGEFYTCRAITSFAISKLNPKIGETVADWACGTGGFLVDALEHLKGQVKLGDNKAMKKIQTSLRGGEFKPLPYKLCVTNLLLHGIEVPNIRYGDSLSEKQYSDFRGEDLVDCAALNPPYGGVALSEDKMSFPSDLRSAETANLFAALTIKRLKKNGRAIIVLGDGFLSNDNDGGLKVIKEMLLKECNLHTVIRLPKSCFAPYTTIATNLLFFDKTGPTKKIWFYRLDMPAGYKHFSKTKPMKREHFAPVDKWWTNRVEIKDEETDTYKAKAYTIKDIVAGGYDLNMCKFPTVEEEILSPEETIKDFHAKRDALNAKIDKRLAELEKMLGVEA